MLCGQSDRASGIHKSYTGIFYRMHTVIQWKIPYIFGLILLLHIFTALLRILRISYYFFIHEPSGSGKEVIHIMKLICAKNELLKSVNISLKAVSSKTTMPILECILIDASATEITFTSNDMELGIETKVKGIIEEKGIVALDAKLFF